MFYSTALSSIDGDDYTYEDESEENVVHGCEFFHRFNLWVMHFRGAKGSPIIYSADCLSALAHHYHHHTLMALAMLRASERKVGVRVPHHYKPFLPWLKRC